MSCIFLQIYPAIHVKALTLLLMDDLDESSLDFNASLFLEFSFRNEAEENIKTLTD